ncbi:hypothetical protein [Actinophytocola gossypii]|uniref:Uncharacterized protein n=1 Tax=Actinophytocola gossypii TaxID=2812003 RepID=A0ABT2JEP0_9PSEU|nr:hypothetical protein [Actinophytocola gossypii]MCT2585994.1 hypothetical protein [Actinophytocola gossypii]
MDERKLTELLRDAVADAPPPTFDRDDVARESGRQLRRRNRALTGSAFGVAILAGIGALGVALWTGPGSMETTGAESPAAASGNENAAPYELPEEGGRGDAETQRGDDQSSSPESRKQGRSSDEEAGPIGPGSTPSGCEQADRELAAALAGELPAAANVEAEDGRVECVDTATKVTFQVPGGTVTGWLVPPGEVVTLEPPPGWEVRRASTTTADGDTVIVASADPADSVDPPYADQLEEWVERIALKF